MIVVFVPGLVCTATAQTPQATQDSPTLPTLSDVRPEILRLVIDDQWDRGNDMFGGRQVKAPDTLDWEAITKRDEERQSAVRALLATGGVETGREYQFAALIFQHSSTPESLALAHVLAVSAVMKGDGGAKWLAAATLDRLLQNLKQPQVFGTQFTRDAGTAPWTMAPYDRAAVADSVRALWCVVPQSDQDLALKDMQSGKTAGANTSVSGCN